MNKNCMWCGATLDAADRVCNKCLSAQPLTAPEPSTAPMAAPTPPPAPPSPTPPPAGPPGFGPPPPNQPGNGGPPPPAGYPPYPGYGPPPAARSNTGRTVAIVIGACVFGLVAIAFVCILAITFLGQKASSKFVAVGPSVSAPAGSGRDYPTEVRSSFLSSCSENAPASSCSCALEKIEDTYTLSEFASAEQDYESSGQLPAPIVAIYTACANGD